MTVKVNTIAEVLDVWEGRKRCGKKGRIVDFDLKQEDTSSADELLLREVLLIGRF